MRGGSDAIEPESVRRARWAVAVVFLANGAAIGSWAPHIPLLKERLGLSPGLLGLALLAMAAGALVAMPLAGILIARWGSAPVARIAGLLFCALLPLPVMAPGLVTLSLALVLFGAANGAMDVAMNAHGFAVEQRLGRPVMSSLHAMYSLGGLAGAGAGGLLLAVMPAAVHASVAAVVLVAAVVVAGRHLLPGAIDTGLSGSTFALPRRGTLVLGLLAFLAFMTEGAILDWGAVHIREGLDAGTTLAAAGFAAFSGAMAIGRFFGDGLRARFGSAGLARASALLAALGLGFGLVMADPYAAVAGIACAGLGLSNIVPILFGAAGRARDQAPATAIAAVATLGYTGLLAGPPLIGFVAEWTTLGLALGLLALACAIIALSARAVWER